MAKPKKNGKYLNVCIDASVYEKLEEMCETAGQSKTTAVERALAAYLKDYEETQEKLRALKEQ
jgi:hypothetical protein